MGLLVIRDIMRRSENAISPRDGSEQVYMHGRVTTFYDEGGTLVDGTPRKHRGSMKCFGSTNSLPGSLQFLHELTQSSTFSPSRPVSYPTICRLRSLFLGKIISSNTGFEQGFLI